jgi:hypothetical protein
MARQTHVKISIPEPCKVPWDGMSPVDSDSRHCSSCDKVITNFSAMSDDELMLYFKHSQGKICGLFSNHQLNRRIKLIPEKTSKAGWWRMMLLIPLSFFSKSAKAQYYQYVNPDKQTQVTSTPQDSITTHQIVEEAKIDSTQNVAIEAAIRAVTQPWENIEITPPDSLVVNFPNQEIVTSELILMGDVITTLGFCSMPLTEPLANRLGLWDILFPPATPIKQDSDQISEPDPLKTLTEQQPEEPTPQQPALPASTDLAAILPKEDRRYKRS